jgi:hypothetical protein
MILPPPKKLIPEQQEKELAKLIKRAEKNLRERITLFKKSKLSKGDGKTYGFAN